MTSRTPTLALRLAALAVTFTAGLPAQLAVVAVSPAAHAIAARTVPSIVVDFDAPVARASIDAASWHVFGRFSGAVDGSLEFANGDRRVVFRPARPLFPGETVTVALSTSVRSVQGAALAAGHAWTFWIETAAASGNFALAATVPVRLVGEGQIQTYGAYAGDLDRDGAPDLSLPNELANDVRVMRNDGCGGFTMSSLHPVAPLGKPSANEGGDFDGDGITDLAVANIDAGALSILIGDGTGGFQPVVDYPSAADPRGLAVLDGDGDGDLDVVTAHRLASTLMWFENRGDGTFEAGVAFDGGSGERALAAADANGDGIGDLFVGNFGSNTVALLLGRGDGTFVASASVAVPTGPWMLVTGDVDGDGHVDAATCCFSVSRVAVVRGNGAGGLFASTSYPVGSRPVAVDLGDLDGDGDLDLVVSNYSGATFSVLPNLGAGAFGAAQTLRAVRAASCTLLVDHDRDGDLDIVGIDEIADVVLVFEQTGPAPNGVQPRSCGAALRVDNRALAAGFGGTSAVVVDAEQTVFLGVSGAPAAACVIVAGIAVEPGISTSLGLLNLVPTAVAELFVGVTDAAGEGRTSLLVPPGLPSGVGLALQPALIDATAVLGVRLGNPEQLIVR